MYRMSSVPTIFMHMSDSPYTFFFLGAGAVLCVALGYGEMAWLRKTTQLSLIWGSVSTTAVVNFLFLVVFFFFATSQGIVMIFPVPIVPAIYLVTKLGLYFVIGKITGQPLHSPALIAFASIPIHGIVGSLFMMGALQINPTRDNLEKSIDTKNDGLFSVLLALSVTREPELTILVNRALHAKNSFALKKLLGAGANPNGDYWLHDGSPDATLIVTKWRIDRHMPLNEIQYIDDIATSYTVEELKYFIDQGLDLKQHTQLIHSVINNKPLNEQGVVDESGIKQMVSKIQLLLSHGADINAPDQYGFNPIFTTVRQGADLAPVLDFIAANGAILDGQSDLKLYPPNEAEIPEGVTALMMTVALGKANETKILLKYGARKNIKDINGDTAYDYAVKRNASDEIKTLLK